MQANGHLARRLAAVALTVTVLVGCHGQPTPSAAGPAPVAGSVRPHVLGGGSGAPVASVASVAFASSSTPVPDGFPLVQYWAAIRRWDEIVISSVDPQERAQWWNTREAALARCMKTEGFLFSPRPVHDTTLDDEETLALDRDYMHIPYLAVNRSDVEAVGYGIEAKVEEESLEADPNQAYAEKLDAKARSAYYIALDGVDHSAPDYDPFAPRDESAGCAAKIDREYPDPWTASPARDMYSRHGDLLSDMTGLTRGGDIFREEPVIRLHREWRSCMARRGFRPDNPAREGSSWDGPYQAFIRARLTDPSGTVGVITDDPSALPDEQNRLVGSVPEREIALLDFDCRQETEYLAVFSQAQLSMEQDFVTANRKELDSLVAFVEGLS